MTDINEEALSKLPSLARIHCSKEEEKKLLERIVSILKYMQQIDEVDVKNIPPCNHVLETMANVMRGDEVGSIEEEELMQQSDFLDNSPSHVGSMIKVPSVIKF